MESVLWIAAGLVLVQALFAWWNLFGQPTVEELGRNKSGAAACRDSGTDVSAGSISLDSSSVHLNPSLPLSAATASALANGRSPAEAPPAAGRTPLVSVLVPARDEERNIVGCLSSVLAQEGVDFELLVLDDHSTDRTALLVRGLALKDARVRLLPGADLPEGWTGKAYACHQLSREAAAPYLLFLDADARLEPGALRRLAAAAAGSGAGLLTGFPRQKLGSWLERLLVPLMMFTVACHLPIRLVRRSSDPRFAAAHGAFMLFRREAYDAVGGHGAVCGELVEDVALARAVKRAGHRLVLADVHREVCMRMYRNSTEVWHGYRKNLYPGLGRNPLLVALLVVFYGGMYVWPLAALALAVIGAAAGFATGGWLLPAALALIVGMAMKAWIDVRNGLSAGHGLLLPVSIAAMLLLALDSWRYAAARKGYEWKGRRYG